ncbi:aldehyde dehydrogenase family protein [Candidatus Uabimicrobium sp. HlEnr_7]|uniref:aldehyde dehydrogenase family protein n=1 Tax=Candidatus Uabimicrobium helgolandensis TaxID=3095367 RepID=UPI003558139C
MSEIERIFRLQSEYSETMKKTTAKQRIELLKKIERHLYQKTPEIYKVCYQDYKKGEMEVDLAEIMPVVSEIKHTIRKLKKWMKPKAVSPSLTMLGTKARLHYEPKGVVLIISPWNYPVNLTLGPLVSALAAGNTVILKPSELTPNISSFLKNFIGDLFEEKQVAVIEGGVEASTELLEQPFHHIFFTGSPMVGKIVMAAAAKNLTSVTLELGGKSPVIVDETSNAKSAAESIMWGKVTNNGQTCIAPDYIFVQKNKKDELIGALKSALEKFYGKQSIEKNNDYCRVVNNKHFLRVKHLIDESIAEGAKLEWGGETNVDDNFISPTILSEVNSNHAVMLQEIFGPVLPIMEYNDIKEVLKYVNNNHKPLAMYIFSSDKRQIKEIIAQTSAGGTAINNTMIHFSHTNLPFGGVNNSGIGSSHGLFGFKAFSHERAVLYQSRLFNLSRMFFPPYTSTRRKLLQLTMKYFT